MTSLVVELHCLVYKNMHSQLIELSTYFHRRLGTLAIFQSALTLS